MYGIVIKVRPAAAGRASIEEEEGGLGVEEGGPNAGRAGRAGGAGGAGGASGKLVVSGQAGGSARGTSRQAELAGSP